MNKVASPGLHEGGLDIQRVQSPISQPLLLAWWPPSWGASPGWVYSYLPWHATHTYTSDTQAQTHTQVLTHTIHTQHTNLTLKHTHTLLHTYTHPTHTTHTQEFYEAEISLAVSSNLGLRILSNLYEAHGLRTSDASILKSIIGSSGKSNLWLEDASLAEWWHSPKGVSPYPVWGTGGTLSGTVHPQS